MNSTSTHNDVGTYDGAVRLVISIVMLMEKNYRAIYRTALLLQELSGIPRLSYAAMRLCSAHGVREATDWRAGDVRGYIASRDVTDVHELRTLCEWAIDNGYGDVTIDCFRRCPVGALDGLKWGIPPPYGNI